MSEDQSLPALIHSMKPRVQQMFEDLLTHDDVVTTGELAKRYQLSDRSIRYDLDEIAKACELLPVRLVHRRSGVWLEGDQKDKLSLKQRLLQWRGTTTGTTVSEMRLYRLLTVLLTEEQPIVAKQVQDLLQASLRTVYADMDRAESWLAGYGLELIRKPHYGAKVEGSELFRRHASASLLTSTCSRLKDLDLRDGPLVFIERLRGSVNPFVRSELVNDADVETLVQVFGDEVQHRSHTSLWWTKLVLYAAITMKRIRRGYQVSMSKANLKQLKQTTEFAFATAMAERLHEAGSLVLSDEETTVLALNMLGAYPNLELNGPGAREADIDPFSQNVVTRMLAAVDDTLGIVLGTDEDLFRGLILHIKPMVHRLLYGMSIENQLLEDIKEEHALAYYAAVIAGRFLEGELDKPLNAAEIGYIALHFGAAIERRRERPNRGNSGVRAMVVCAGGIGTGKILQSRIEASLTNLHVVDALDQSQVQGAKSLGADVIVSTLELSDAPVPYIVVNPLLPLSDYHRLNRWVASVTEPADDVPAAATGALTQPMLDVIGQHFEVLEPATVAEEIQHLLTRVSPYLAKRQMRTRTATDNAERDRRKVLRMLDLLTEDCIQVQVHAAQREQVVEAAGRLLVESGAVEPRYVDAMKTSLDVNGPYMVIVPGIALCHARPDDGVNRVCMSLVTLSEGVVFGHKDNDPVDIAIAFGAVDNQAHLQALSDLMRLLADESSLKAIRAATDAKQVLNIINKVMA